MWVPGAKATRWFAAAVAAGIAAPAGAQAPAAGTTTIVERESLDLAATELEYQAVLRNHRQEGLGPVVTAEGVSPLRLVVSGALYGRWPVGLAVELAREGAAVRGPGLSGQPETVPFALYGAQVGPTARIRLGPLVFHGFAGYAYEQLPLIDSTGAALAPAPVQRHAVVVAARAVFPLSPRFGAHLEGRLPLAFATSSPVGALDSTEFSLAGGVRMGRVDLAGLKWSLAADYAFVATQVARRGDGLSVRSAAHRIGLGLSAAVPDPNPERIAVYVPPPPPPPPPPKPTGPGSIAGRVVSGDRKVPLPGVKVTASGVEARTDVAGAFTLGPVGPGPVSIRVEAAGYEALEDAVVVPPEAKASVDFTLRKLGVKALATLRGVVRSASGATVAAHLLVVEPRITTKVAANGRFAVRLPGGRYTLVIDAPGFLRQTKVVQVADGEDAVFNVDLHPIPR